MTITALLYCYRLPSLTPAQFHDYIENTHVPYVKSLLGTHYPKSHTRYYTNKHAGYALGTVSEEDPDLVAVIEYESEERMRESMKVRMGQGVREKIQEDEDRFMVRERVKLIVLGEGAVSRGGRVV